MAQTASRKSVKGWMCLTLWAILIVAGIVAKRKFGHADWMVFFHLPAAVFLVTSFHILSYDLRQRHRRQAQLILRQGREMLGGSFTSAVQEPRR
ncbi:MAG: hypothetical protein JST16_03205 [Bdellovibrionales bacterium]|nr:hypothetical protein [Bdellovibrionales bacterium]